MIQIKKLTVGELVQSLSEKYQVLCCIDLATINQNHSAIYKIFSEHRKDVFEPNERLVFYSSGLPSDRLLKHIQKAANLIDISSCFIMICGPHDLTKQLQSLSHDNNVIEYYPALLESKSLDADQLNDESTICPLPWMHLEIKHNGNIHPCCVSTTCLGSANENNLNTVMQGEQMQKLRSEFLSGQKPQGCQHCWKLESNGQQSNRQWHVKHYEKKFYSEYLDNPKIRSLDIKPGNVCNFKCRICNPINSSLYAEEYYLKTKIAIKSANSRWLEYNVYVWDQLEKLLPDIENLDFYGGEPFLIKEIPKLLQSAIDQKRSKHMRLHFNTNGSVFPTKLIPLLKQFRHVDVALSIDNIGQRFELERGGEWAEVQQNIFNFKKLNSENFSIYLMPTVNIQNIYYLDELFEWAEQNQIRVTLNFLDDPQWVSIDYLTPNAIKLVVDKFKNSTYPELRALATRVSRSSGSNGIEFVKHSKRFDILRGQDFAKSHREIARAMGY